MPQNRNVLIVDDDAGMRSVMTAMIGGDGYSILTAPNGDEALSVAETIRVDLLITDMRMPGMTGTELIMALTARGLIERYLLVTGDLGSINAGGDWPEAIPFLRKPFDAADLVEKVRSLFND